MCSTKRYNESVQDDITRQQAEQEGGLRDMQRLVGGALAVPREIVQPAFAALGQCHMSILRQHAALQQQPGLVTAVTQCIGKHRLKTCHLHSVTGACSRLQPL